MGWEKRSASRRRQSHAVWQRLRLSPSVGLQIAVLALSLVCAAGATAFPAARPLAAAPAAQTNGALAIVGAGGATLYTTPGGDQVATLEAGTVLTAVGRSADNLWVVVNQRSGDAGWVEVDQVVLFGISELPVMIEGASPAAPAEPTTAAAASPVPAATVSLPTLTPTPRPSPTPLPTPTPSPTPSPTPTSVPPTPVPAPLRIGGGQASLVAVVRGGGAALYDRPNGTVIGQLTTGTALTVWGRSDDSSWLVVSAGGNVAGWVEKPTVVAFDLETLPVVDGTAAAANAANSAPAVSTTSDAPAQDGSPAASVSTTPAPAGEEFRATVAVTDSRLNIRTGPGTSYAILGKALPGDSFVATGRNTQASWVEIATPDLGDGFGWVAVEFVTLSRPVPELPISERVGARASASDEVIAPEVTASGVAAPGVTAVVSTRGSAASAQPAGRLVFQSAASGQIYVYELGTGALYPLTAGFDPAISPDGRTVAFTRYGGDQGLYLVDIDGKNERRIYLGGQPLRAPTWSPDGAWIAFVRVQGTFRCRDLGFGFCIPDFEQLRDLLEDFPLENRPEWALSRVNTDGQEFRDLSALTSAQAPNWHTDGIVYGSVSSIEITKDEPDFTTRVVYRDPHLQDPDWQPGGDRIVFQIQQGSHWEIYTISPDGSGLQNLTRPVTTLVEELPSNVAPAWSPDGRSIVYLSNRNDENDAGAWRLWVMGADGSNQRPLPVDVPLDYSYANEQVVSWGISG